MKEAWEQGCDGVVTSQGSLCEDTFWAQISGLCKWALNTSSKSCERWAQEGVYMNLILI